MFFYTLLIGVYYFLSPSLADFGDDDALILTPYIKKGCASLARNLSRVDSTKFLGLESYSGFITVKEEYDSNLFFWYFPHEKANDVPWVIWLQGGPGVTSLLGVFDGVGPLKIDKGNLKDPTLKLKNLTWAADYSLLFVDNPVGAGFSFTKDERGYTDNEDDIGQQLLEFLVQFLQVFPELQQAPLFLAGQSYSGKYLPAFGAYIHNRKNNATINFRGIAIGNGLIDPKSQMTEGHSKLCDSLGLLSDEDLITLSTIQQDCVTFIDTGKMVDASNKFNESIEFIKKRSGINIYNFNKDPSSGVHPLEPFVEAPSVRTHLHVGRAEFNFNNQRVYRAMLPDIMNTTKPFLEELLEHYGVMCYTGQLDVILPHALAKPMYSQFRWSRRGEYERARRKRLRSADDGNVVGYRKSGGNFVDVIVRNAGHMVAGEQPEVLKYIIDTFISDFK